MNPFYKYIKDGEETYTSKEVWCWEAIYNDGSVLKQFDDDGMFHKFEEIDQNKLELFRMVSDSFKQVYSVPFNSDTMNLAHKYIITRLNVGTPEYKEIKSYCFGYEKKNGDKHYIVILPDGESILCEDPNIINFE